MSGRASLPPAPGQRVELRVGTLRISGGSRLEALRIADALPSALEAAIAGKTRSSRRPTPVERVALGVLEAVAQRGETAE